MVTNVSRAKIFATKSSFEQRCERAHASDCAHELVTLLGSIGMEKGRDDEKRTTFQGVLERKLDVGPVALQCLYHLSILGPESHRKAVETIIEGGFSPDTDHIYAGAIHSMLKLRDLGGADIRMLAGALFSSSREVRSSARLALRSLEPHQLRTIIELNRENIAACAPLARALTDLAEKVLVEVEVFQATVLPGLEGNARQSVAKDATNSMR